MRPENVDTATRLMNQWHDGLYRAVGKIVLNAAVKPKPLAKPLLIDDKYVPPLDKSKIKLEPMTDADIDALFAANLARGIIADLKPNQFE